MTWNAYQITFKLLSPMHIGWRKAGNLQQTRSYLIGRNLWGGLTARITRDKSTNNDNYEETGNQVHSDLTYTYFYPSTQKDNVKFWPWQDQEEFAWQFLNSYASTALADGHSSEEGSLHETEFISPFTRKGEQVYLLGYIFEKEGCTLNWQDALGKLRFGGEQGYGWGRLQPELKTLKPLETNECFGKYTLDCTGDWPTITVPANDYLLAHTRANSNSAVRGIIEPLVGLETRKEGGFGQYPSVAEICYQPGSTATVESIFYIAKFGIWNSKYDETSSILKEDNKPA